MLPHAQSGPDCGGALLQSTETHQRAYVLRSGLLSGVTEMYVDSYQWSLRAELILFGMIPPPRRPCFTVCCGDPFNVDCHTLRYDLHSSIHHKPNPAWLHRMKDASIMDSEVSLKTQLPKTKEESTNALRY